METLNYKQFREEMIKNYNIDTPNWSASLTKSTSGFYNWLFLGPGFAWKLKTDSIYNPNPIGFGGKIEIDSEKYKSRDPSFGFRPFPIKQILELARDDLDDVTKEQIIGDIIENLRSVPRPTGWINSPAVAEGPFDLPTREIVLGEKQKELDEKLEYELRRAFRARNYYYG